MMKASQSSLEKAVSTGREWNNNHEWQNIIVLSAIVLALIFSFLSPANVHAQTKASRTITLWSQTLDSCRRAITGSTYRLTGPGVNATQGNLPAGAKQASILIIPEGTGNCPVQQGNCVKFASTCLQWHLMVPSKGTATYTLSIIKPATGHAGCVGGSVCPSPDLKHPGTQIFESATITITSKGSCSAQVINRYPNWTTNKSSVRVFPTADQHETTAYTCKQTDPVVFHESATHAAVSQSPNDCDNDHDADDHTTGAEGWSPRCDNDGDWNSHYRAGQHYTGGVSGASE
jgi:hypothetical protein